MTTLAATLSAFINVGELAVLVRIAEAKGSTPREAGATMLVTLCSSFGTIGGGQMEFLAIEEARRLIAKGEEEAVLDVPLGPAIGQCCGGHVRIVLNIANETTLRDLEAAEQLERASLAHVYLFGAGHVGLALAHALNPLPLMLHVVETRADELAGLPGNTAIHLTPLPEATVAQARAGSLFVVLTHDHALDFVITAAAINRNDAAYVGMIGSATKKAAFASWFAQEGHDGARLSQLACPIGGSAVHDKRPEVIAALVAAEIVGVLFGEKLQEASKRQDGEGKKSWRNRLQDLN